MDLGREDAKRSAVGGFLIDEWINSGAVDDRRGVEDEAEPR